ncbi:MAG: ATP phosphoribosyltransferase regulatory subunit [Gammaproteobacteria bacterium]|nr:ATP phosphoribosyltransferase regulatory subunit [Gammaproteobacteria bacterium]MCP5199032.1 ATP phosphoribosyltransferase regulatory subunit [Gammaproteobacteria bacterium]
MGARNRWLLPDGVDEVLPPRARQVEALRRRLLDVFERWGYDLVVPPVIEYLDSLLSGIGEDLDLQTFKLIDQVTGRMMGVRADITPQVARIDAHRLPADHPQRFCYIGPVLHTLPDKFAGSRNPLQIGAELYGHTGIESDAEVIALLLEILGSAGIGDVTLELGHMGLFHAICEHARIDAEIESRILEVLLLKDASGLEGVLEQAGVDDAVRGHLGVLLELNGDLDVLARARHALAVAPAAVGRALDDVERLIELLAALAPRAQVHLDFAELRGYRYHTGVMFAAYTPAAGRAIAWGGRYDNIGQSFGRARSATGFSTDLNVLAELSATPQVELGRIFAPAGTSPDLLAAMRDLRAAGYRVVQGLPGQQGDAAAMGCAQCLSDAGGSWQLEDV